jgi:hypothetical protein
VFHKLCAVILVSNGKDDVEDELVDEAEYYAWNELRLNPALMKSIYRLGFKEPTPIQKACIPAAAHQGKVGQGSCLWWCMRDEDIKLIVFLTCVCDRMLLVLRRQGLGKHWLLVYPFYNVSWRNKKKLIGCLKRGGKKQKRLLQKAFYGLLLLLLQGNLHFRYSKMLYPMFLFTLSISCLSA